MGSTVFDRSVSAVESMYTELGYKIGWRFITAKSKTLSDATEIALITMNPGGSVDPPDHPHESQEKGSAYLVESWGGQPIGRAKLQIQVQRLFKELHASVANGEPFGGFVDKIFSAHFVPFRSESFGVLAHKHEALQFATQLWLEIFQELRPRVIFVIDKETWPRLLRIHERNLGGKLVSRECYKAGWGKCTGDVVKLEFDDHGRPPVTLIRLPHLSRYTLMGRAASRPFI